MNYNVLRASTQPWRQNILVEGSISHGHSGAITKRRYDKGRHGREGSENPG